MAKAKGKKSGKAEASKKARTPAQKEATRKLVAANKARAKGTLKAKAPKAKAPKAKAPKAKAKAKAPKGGGLEARVSKLETTVRNHGEVLSNVVGVLEEHDRALNALNNAFGMGSAPARNNRTVMMETVPN